MEGENIDDLPVDLYKRISELEIYLGAELIKMFRTAQNKGRIIGSAIGGIGIPIVIYMSGKIFHVDDAHIENLLCLSPIYAIAMSVCIGQYFRDLKVEDYCIHCNRYSNFIKEFDRLDKSYKYSVDAVLDFK